MKRRLAAVLDRAEGLRGFVQATLATFNGSQATRAASIVSMDSSIAVVSPRSLAGGVRRNQLSALFDANQLAALRMEDPVVFDEVHRFAFELS